MPRRNESIFKYDDDLLRELESCHTAAERRIVLKSRKLAILSDRGWTMTAVLPLEIYNKLEGMKVSYRTLAYQKILEEHYEQHKA